MQREIIQIDLPEPEDNFSETKISFVLSASGMATGEKSWSGNGSLEASKRGFFKRVRPEDYQRIFQRSFASWSPNSVAFDPKVSGLNDLAKPFHYSSKFKVPNLAQKAGPLLILKLPEFVTSFSEVSRKDRTYPIDYRTTRLVKSEWRVSFPKSWKIRAKPSGFSIEHPAGMIRQVVEVRENDLLIRRESRIDRPKVTVSDYSKHREALKRVESASQERVFFEVSP